MSNKCNLIIYRGETCARSSQQLNVKKLDVELNKTTLQVLDFQRYHEDLFIYYMMLKQFVNMPVIVIFTLIYSIFFCNLF